MIKNLSNVLVMSDIIIDSVSMRDYQADSIEGDRMFVKLVVFS